jgi:hypothetical protein
MIVGVERAPYLMWRAVAATVLVMSGALLAHGWADGRPPTGPGLAVLTGVVLVSGLLVLRGTIRGRVLLPLVAVAQLGLHESFGLLGSGAHGHEVADVGTSWTWQMVAAHATVTLLTALTWRLCERAALAIVAVLELWQPQPRPTRALRRRTDRARVAVRLAFLTADPDRGPPMALSHA